MLIKHTNLDITDAACLHVVYILQHPTSHPTTRSTQEAMVNAPKMFLSPLQAAKYGISTKQSTWQPHYANKGKSSLGIERVLGLGGLRSLRSKKNHSAEKSQDTHIWRNEENEKWTEDHVDWETVGLRKWVDDSDTEIMQHQEDMRTAETAQSTTRTPETPLEQILNAIGDSLSHPGISDNEEDG